MRSMLLTLFIFLISSTTLFADKLDVKGELSYEFKEIKEQSEKSRLNNEYVNLMTVKKGPGKEVITQKLIKHFEKGQFITTKADDNWQISMRDDANVVTGSGWNLTVFNDGTKVNYRNSKYVNENKAKFGKDKEMSLDELKEAGEKFIKEDLKDFVKLEVGEELVFIRSIYEVDGVQNDDGSCFDETLASNIAYFGRKKDGLMLVGNSAIVIVEFSNDRKPVSFYYDWKEYEKMDEQIRISPKEEIDYRISSLSSLNYGNIEHLEVDIICGLYDDSKYVQPACEIQQKGKYFDGKDVGIINVIPAGKKYYSNASWIELELLQEFGDVCRESDITEEIFPENEK
ncbi:MAG TPA: hypothetical protein PLD55_14185 [bacterium]|jgi:hypothetical protein|nr:hypothetical protein [bacterium]HNZ53002.1 hypothetical protein [bacterium]HOG42827.1 hypothetical protein [bacterium]HPY13952.1 hypothetical protein [bacterium]HQB10453.1 hypothetical protein [bacterium]